MKTAIDWLIEQTRTPEWHSLQRQDIIEGAKEKEKQQIIRDNRAGIDMVLDKKNWITGEQYHDEAYGS